MATVAWKTSPVQEWIKMKETENWKKTFEENGYLVIQDLLDQESLQQYQSLCRRMLDGEIDTTYHRMDLGAHEEKQQKNAENVCQIMWPSQYVKGLLDGPLHQRTEAVAKILLGEDMAFDFDMFIAKAPYTNTPVPWHQDEGYWPDMPDKRAISFWVAMDNAVRNNGCMWFVPGSHLKPLREHKKAKEGYHAQTCEGSEEEAVSVPISAGSCTLHHGRTVHYTRGNTTDTERRAYIVNYRPEAMIKWERQHNFDHGKNEVHVSFESHVSAAPSGIINCKMQPTFM